MKMKTCSTCTHWKKITHWGMCKGIPHITAYSLKNPDVPAVILTPPLPPDINALSTSPDFGCVLHEDKRDDIPY